MIERLSKRMHEILIDEACLSGGACEFPPCACADRLARAALEELLTPTIAMRDAGLKAWKDGYGKHEEQVLIDVQPAMIERLARAICKNDMLWTDPEASEADIETNWYTNGDIYMSHARVGFAEIREPEHYMVLAAVNPMASNDEEQSYRTWQAHIDAALEHKP